MTIEPDALSLFRRDRLAHHFDIKLLPPSSYGFQGHDQDSFGQWSADDRLESTRTLLRDMSVLTLHADAFVVTGSSNIGLVSMMLGGLDHIVASADYRFRPMAWVRPPSSPVGHKSDSYTADGMVYS